MQSAHGFNILNMLSIVCMAQVQHSYHSIGFIFPLLFIAIVGFISSLFCGRIGICIEDLIRICINSVFFSCDAAFYFRLQYIFNLIMDLFLLLLLFPLPYSSSQMGDFGDVSLFICMPEESIFSQFFLPTYAHIACMNVVECVCVCSEWT